MGAPSAMVESVAVGVPGLGRMSPICQLVPELVSHEAVKRPPEKAKSIAPSSGVEEGVITSSVSSPMGETLTAESTLKSTKCTLLASPALS